MNDIYIYIYIVIHRLTVSFYQNSSLWLDTRDRNPSNFTLDCVSDHSSTKRTNVYLFLETAAAAFVYIFYTLSATRVLNSFEELCIMLAAAGNSFDREFNPHGGAYIVIHRQTVSLCQNSSVWLDARSGRTLEAGIETRPTLR